MDNSRHRQILSVLRPHGADRLDPEAQPALAATQSDSHLGAWFEREQAFDRAFAARAQSAPVPAHLRASIFAAVDSAARAQPAPRRRIVLHRPVATLIAALAAAASLTLVAVLLWPRHARPIDLQSMMDAAVAIAPDDAPAHDLPGRPLDEIRDWLAGRSAPVPGELPMALAHLRTEGTGTVDLHGIKASVVAFAADGFSRHPISGETGRRLVLFTVPRQSCSTQGITRAPAVREAGGHALAVWRDASSVYVLAVDASGEDLRRFLGTAARLGWQLSPQDRYTRTDPGRPRTHTS